MDTILSHQKSNLSSFRAQFSGTANHGIWSIGLLLALLGSAPMTILAAEPSAPGLLNRDDVSYKNELRHAIDRGLASLQSIQDSNGWWSVPGEPAVTALALMAFEGEPSGRYSSNKPAWMERGYKHILDSVHPDGGIHRTSMVTYNTSLSMMALVAANRPEYEPIILKARQYLIGLQTDFGVKGETDNVFDGGVGYGSRYSHSDMGNTLQALEALYYSKHLVEDKKLAETRDLNWGAAIRFLQSCQNLPSHNPEPWASDDPQNKGGFIYFPGSSKADSVTNAVTGRVALRSYGSISYGGMLSYMYADLKMDDPRVRAVYDWLRNNYTLEENPAMGLQGLYFYYRTMTKALTAFGIDELELTDGRKIDWRRDLSRKLLDLQRADGSWLNENGRWWERHPSLVNAYVVLTLEMILNSY